MYIFEKVNKTVKTGIIPGNYLKLYKLRKLGFIQKYLNLLLFNNSNKFIINK